jgi:hypothetical protein
LQRGKRPARDGSRKRAANESRISGDWRAGLGSERDLAEELKKIPTLRTS